MKQKKTYIQLIILIVLFTGLFIYNEFQKIYVEEDNSYIPIKEVIEKPIIEDEVTINEDPAEETKKEETTKNSKPNKPVDEVKPTPPVEEPVKTQEQTNDELRKSLQTKYGITIKYGHEMEGYLIAGEYTPTYLTDADVINESLRDVDSYISYYPKGFFKEMKDFEMPLTIHIVKNIPNSGIAGIADKEFYNDIRITVCTDEFFFRVLHHELFHYIEAYMETISYYKGGVFNGWNDLNPTGFKYGTTVDAYSYSLLDTTKTPYFINNYGQTNEREDRATLFEDLMARTIETKNSFISPNPIWYKGKMIAEEIDKWFDTVNSSTTERWERFIYI